jgi:hypothetical protein
MITARFVSTLLTIVSLTTACLSPASTHSARQRPDGTSVNAVITTAELSRLEGNGSLMDALHRLRPLMLAPRRGALPVVSIDRAPPEEISVLRHISASAVREVRLVRSPSRASSGINPGLLATRDVIAGDLILVSTKNGSVLRR